jgi:hypothetical protein
MGKREMPKPENLGEYFESKKQPYAFEYFNVNDLSKLPSYQKYSQFIDEFVMGEMQKNSLDGTFDSYGHIIEDVMSELNLSPDTNSAVKMEKLYKWIKNILGPSRRLEERKRKIIG